MVEGVKSGGVGRPSALTPASSATAFAANDASAKDSPFVVNDGAAPLAQNAHPSAVAGIGLASMLMLQAVEEGTERDRVARRRGNAILTVLSDLQRALLAEADPSAALRTLSELSADIPLADDPGLGAILRAVILRSRVEVARRERQPG